MNILPLILWGHFTFVTSKNTDPGDVVYIRPPNERGPTTWQSGLQCLQAIGTYFLYINETRAKLTMVITHSVNLTTPADQIQEQYLIMKNEAVTSRSNNNTILGSFLTSVISDVKPLPVQKFQADFIVFTDSYVIIVDSMDRIGRFFKEYISKIHTWNPGARFLILYNHVDDRNRSLEIANKIFGLLLLDYYVNTVSLLYAINNTAYDYYVLDNFNKDACRTVKSVKITTCNMGKITNEFMTKIRINILVEKSSLKNCTFYMCAAIAAPFIEPDCVNGIEMSLINLIKNKINFKLNISCGDRYRGVRENGTWTELLGSLNNRECDFVIGGFFSDNEVREDFWATDSYLQDSHTWFTAAAETRPPWKALFVIFQSDIWLSIVVVFLITWLFWLLFGCILPEKDGHKSATLTAINSWGVTLNAAVNERPECHTSRIFFIGLCLYSMNVTSIYTSKLIAVFANPGYEHQISTIEEVIHKGIPYGGPAENRDWFENSDDMKMKIYTGYNDSDYFKPQPANVLAVLTGERVILANRMFMLRDQNVDRLYGFPDNVFSSSVEIITKRGFPFLRRFNSLIRQLKDGGFFSKIDKDFRYHYTVLVRIRKIRKIPQEAVIVLTIYHLEGAFEFLIFGILLSSMVFAGEQINYRYFYPWLCKKFDWKIETETEQQTRKQQHHHHHHHHHQQQHHRAKKAVQKKRQRQKEAQTTTTRDEMRTIINVQMEQIRFTPLKRRKIRLN